jgi:hypothetical protein
MSLQHQTEVAGAPFFIEKKVESPPWYLAPWAAAALALGILPEPHGERVPMTSEQLKAMAADIAEANRQLVAQIPQWDSTSMMAMGAVALAGGALTYVAARRGGHTQAVPAGILSLVALGMTYAAAAPPPPPWEGPLPPKPGILGSVESEVQAPVKATAAEVKDLKTITLVGAVAVPLVTGYWILKTTRSRGR